MVNPTGRTTPRGRFAVWQRLLRGYGPFILLASLALGMAVFVPSKVQHVASGAPGAASGPAVPGASNTTVAPGDVAGNPATGGAATPGGGAAAGGGSSPPGAQACAGGDLQIPGDPYSPPCATFAGDNGGATYRGVTGTEVHVAIRSTQDASLDDAIAEIVGANIVDKPEDVKRTLIALVQYFNNHFQMYGRKIVLDFYEGQGSIGNEIVGNGRDKAEVDATKVAEEIKPFADLTGISEPYSDALARKGVIAFGGPVLSRDWFTARRPFAWSVLPDCSSLTEDAAEYTLKRLYGGTADFAGGDAKGKPRVITALAPENSWYQECVHSSEGILASKGAHFDVDPLTYQLDLSSFSNQATNIIAKLKAEGVTTILCGCDPIFPIFLSGVAARENYFPEFVSGYEQDFIGQLWDKEFTKHAFGISPLGGNTSQSYYDTVGYAAYKSVASDEPAHAVDGLYYQLYMLALGIQLAGPNLTPDTYEAGMFSYGDHLGPAGLWGFGPGDYTPMDDFHEIFWSPTAISTYNGKPGAWTDPYPGRRYRHGQDQMDPGPPAVVAPG